MKSDRLAFLAAAVLMCYCVPGRGTGVMLAGFLPTSTTSNPDLGGLSATAIELTAAESPSAERAAARAFAASLTRCVDCSERSISMPVTRPKSAENFLSGSSTHCLEMAAYRRFSKFRHSGSEPYEVMSNSCPRNGCSASRILPNCSSVGSLQANCVCSLTRAVLSSSATLFRRAASFSFLEARSLASSASFRSDAISLFESRAWLLSSRKASDSKINSPPIPTTTNNGPSAWTTPFLQAQRWKDVDRKVAIVTSNLSNLLNIGQYSRMAPTVRTNVETAAAHWIPDNIEADRDLAMKIALWRARIVGAVLGFGLFLLLLASLLALRK